MFEPIRKSADDARQGVTGHNVLCVVLGLWAGSRGTGSRLLCSCKMTRIARTARQTG